MAKRPSKSQRKAPDNFTFYTFAALRHGAESLYSSATEHPDGSGYCRLSAVLFSAFSIEAYLNFIGEELVSNWATTERTMSWKDKLKLIGKTVGVKVDFGKPPFDSIRTMFHFRDKLAHGRTHSGRAKADQDLTPDWLAQFKTDASVRKVLDDARSVVDSLHAKSGLERPVGVIASGAIISPTRKKPQATKRR